MGTSQGHPDRSGINRYGEENIRPGHYEGLGHAIDWSSDPRSESSLEKHRGKGPKNFSRSDDFLYEEVCEALLMNPDLDPEFINVEVKNSVVILTGHVRIRDDRYLAEDLAWDVSGVTDVVNNISRGKFDVGDDPGGLIKGIR